MDGACTVPGGEDCSAPQSWAVESSGVPECVKNDEDDGLRSWVDQPAQETNAVLHSDERIENDESTQSSFPPADVARRGGRDRTRRTTSAGVTSSSGYPGVSWNRRMGAWLAFFYDDESRRSRTFHPKYYDFDVEAARLAAIEFMKTVENRERPKRSAKSVDTSTPGPRKKTSPPHKSKARASQSCSHDQVSDAVKPDANATPDAIATQHGITLLSECPTEGHSNASDSHLSVSSHGYGHESSVSTMASTEPPEWQLVESRAAEVCELWTHPYVKCEHHQTEAIGEETCENPTLEEHYQSGCHLIASGSFPQLESGKHEQGVVGECRLCVAAEVPYDEQLESTSDTVVDGVTEGTNHSSHEAYESAPLPQVEGELTQEEEPHPSDCQSVIDAGETKAGDDDSNPSTYAPSARRAGVDGSEAPTGDHMTDEHDMEEDSCHEADPDNHDATGLSRAGSDVMSELMPRVGAASPCPTEDQKKMSESLLRSYSTDSVVYPNQSSEFFPLQSMTLAEELSGDMSADGRTDSGLQESGGDSTGNEGGGHDQLPAWLAEDLVSAGNAIASAGGNLHRAVLDRRGSWRGLARLRSQDSISAFMGGRADLMFTGLEGMRPSMNGGLSRSGSMMCIQDPTMPPLYMNLKTEYREDGPLRKAPSGPLGKIGSDGFPEYLSSRGGASPVADHRKSGNYKPVNTCLASDSPALENVVWDSTGEPQHYASCPACP